MLLNPFEPELPLIDNNEQNRNLEYKFLEDFESPMSSTDASDIDTYFDTPSISFKLKKGDDQTQWTMSWWEAHKQEFPAMAAAARDYLAIPASEVDIERLFNVGRDVLGIRHFSMSGNTLRTNAYSS